MRCKKAVITTVIATSFLLGITLSEPIKDTRKYLHYEIAEGFYGKPYNLKIETRKNMEGKIEAYLTDEETKQYRKIKPNEFEKSQLNETIEKTMDFIERIYKIFLPLFRP